MWKCVSAMCLQSTPVGSLTHEVPSPHRGGTDDQGAAAGGKRQADARGQARVRMRYTATAAKAAAAALFSLSLYEYHTLQNDPKSLSVECL